jgi:hypothetical protein
MGIAASSRPALTYLLRDDFTAAQAAPLAGIRTAVPGPGTLTITDPANLLSVAGGELLMTGNGSFVTPHVYSQGVARTAGQALYLRVKMGTSASVNLQFMVTSAKAPGTAPYSQMDGASSDAGGFIFDSGSLQMWEKSGNPRASGLAVATGTYYDLAIVLRSSGHYLFARIGGVWRLVWVSNGGSTATVYAAVQQQASASTSYIDAFRVAPLAGSFASDYGFATQRNAGLVAAGTAVAHEGDFKLEWTQTTLPATTARVSFRSGWYVTVTSAGVYTLYDPTDTVRGTPGTGVAAGNRMAVIAEGSAIRVYRAGVLGPTYTSATVNQTATAGSVVALGGGTVSDVVAWPRTPSGAALTGLDLLAA